MYVAEATRADGKACAMHWTGSRWQPFYLPGSPGPCIWTTSDYRRGLWLIGPAGPEFTWVHWTGKRFIHTAPFTPNSSGYNTDGFSIAAVPHSSSVWLFGSYCNLSLPCRTKGSSRSCAELRQPTTDRGRHRGRSQPVKRSSGQAGQVDQGVRASRISSALATAPTGSTSGDPIRGSQLRS